MIAVAPISGFGITSLIKKCAKACGSAGATSGTVKIYSLKSLNGKGISIRLMYRNAIRVTFNGFAIFRYISHSSRPSVRKASQLLYGFNLLKEKPFNLAWTAFFSAGERKR